MAADLKELRDQFQADSDEWSEARDERAKDIRYLSGDPWDPADKDKRIKAGRPFLAFDELNQYVNQVVNDLRANPRAVAFAPAPDDSEQDSDQADKRSQLYADKMREVEYRSNAKLAYTIAAENAIQGGYGYVRLTAKYAPKSVRNQELWIDPVPDPDCVIPDPFHRKPDGSDMQRCFVLEHRRLDQFRRDFPNAKEQNFEAYYKDAELQNWVTPDRILLAESWTITNRKRKVVIVQPPAVTPPPGMMGMRPEVLPPAIEVWADELEEEGLPAGAEVLDEREADDPQVTMRLVNGVEILDETDWPGQYIPIIPCYGKILYVPDGGRTKRQLMSMIRQARDPYMAHCWSVTGAHEVAGSTTKNPYWAYRGQLNAKELNAIAKSVHEPVAVLEAGQYAGEDHNGERLPLPQRNDLDPSLSGWATLIETDRRAIQSAIASNFLPTVAQRQNEKSGKALERIEQSSQKGTFHFIDHYEGMIRQVGVVFEDVFDKFYDARRKIGTRKADDSTEAIWINDPQNPEAVDVKGRHAVTVSSGPDFDSTREAASDFADTLIGSDKLMMLLGPQKAQQIVARAVKLKVRETGIGAIGDQIVEIIDPPADQQASPEQMQQENAQLKQQLQQAQQMLQQAAQEQEAGLSKERAKTERDLLLAQIDQKFQAALQQLKGQQSLEQIAAKGATDLRKQDDAQRHELGLAGEDQAAADRMAERADMMTVAQMGAAPSSNTLQAGS